MGYPSDDDFREAHGHPAPPAYEAAAQPPAGMGGQGVDDLAPLRRCEACHGTGPCLWDSTTQRYCCSACHPEPGDPFFHRDSPEKREPADLMAALKRSLGLPDAPGDGRLAARPTLTREDIERLKGALGDHADHGMHPDDAPIVAALEKKLQRMLLAASPPPPNHNISDDPCPLCQGRGSFTGAVADRDPDSPCRECHGRGRLGRRPDALTIDSLVREVRRARAKFPGNRYLLAALMEEVGELAQAFLQRRPQRRADIIKEALQVACVALRIVEEGDPVYDDMTPEEALP